VLASDPVGGGIRYSGPRAGHSPLPRIGAKDSSGRKDAVWKSDSRCLDFVTHSDYLGAFVKRGDSGIEPGWSNHLCAGNSEVSIPGSLLGLQTGDTKTEF